MVIHAIRSPDSCSKANFKPHLPPLLGFPSTDTSAEVDALTLRPMPAAVRIEFAAKLPLHLLKSSCCHSWNHFNRRSVAGFVLVVVVMVVAVVVVVMRVVAVEVE